MAQERMNLTDVDGCVTNTPICNTTADKRKILKPEIIKLRLTENVYKHHSV